MQVTRIRKSWVLEIHEPVCPCCSKLTSKNEYCTRCQAVYSDAERDAVQLARHRFHKLGVLYFSMTPAEQSRLKMQRISNEMAADQAAGVMLAGAGLAEDNAFVFASGLAIANQATATAALRASTVRTKQALSYTPELIRATLARDGSADFPQQRVTCEALGKTYIVDVMNAAATDPDVVGSFKLRRVIDRKMCEFEYEARLDDRWRRWNVVPF